MFVVMTSSLSALGTNEDEEEEMDGNGNISSQIDLIRMRKYAFEDRHAMKSLQALGIKT